MKNTAKKYKKAELMEIASLFQLVDLPEENRKGVMRVANPIDWSVVHFDLAEYSEQVVTIKFSADVKRIGAAGSLRWQITNKNYPTVGTPVPNAAQNKWFTMSGEWTGTLEGEVPAIYLNTWRNNSEKTTYFIDNVALEIIAKGKKQVRILPEKARNAKGVTKEIKELLKDEGCKLFGFADLCELPDDMRKKAGKSYVSGIIIGSTYNAQGMKENLEGNADIYANDDVFEPAHRCQAEVTEFLKSNGYKAKTTYSPCKTLGTISGLGWIGRSAMLTTEKAGPALVLAAVLTDAPLEYGTPIKKSLCPPDCTVCADICPTNAIGTMEKDLWERGIHRDEFFDVEACKKGRKERKPMCGLCISACPLTRKGFNY
jgi:ferredoxin